MEADEIRIKKRRRVRNINSGGEAVGEATGHRLQVMRLRL